jgi:Fe-S-cluster containining protein
MESTVPDEPWYRDGLRFRCTQCGHCCTGAPGYVWVNDEEIERIAAQVQQPVEEFRRRFVRQVDTRFSLREKANGDCIMYDRERGCTIYPVRPRQCRSWPFWDSNLVTPEAWEETCQVCPGSGQGELISHEEIVANLNRIRL